MHKTLKVLWFLTKLGLVCLLLGIITVYGMYKYFEPELPSVESIKEYRLQVPLRVYSQDEKLMAVFGTKRRIPVAIEDIPLRVKQAYLAAEDANFYDHHGFDIKGILRAAWQIITTGQKQSGGSTITQQLTRNVFLSLDQTWSRKIKELFLSVKLERTISKDEILELYLNKILLGHRAYGVAAAADVYYGKTLDQLTLAQMAMLAAPPKAPSRINPITSPERALQRRNYVLARMLELKFISRQEYEQAVNEPDEARLHEPEIEISAPWVAEMVRIEMLERFGDDAYTDGYRVVTTIDSALQISAQTALQKGLEAYDKRHGYRGPVQHYDAEALQDLDQLTEQLNEFPKPAGMQAALVLSVDEREAQARLGDGQDILLNFEDSDWAAPYVDNYRVGNKPQNMTEVLKTGDVVMVARDNEGEFLLSQIPNVQGALVSSNPKNGQIYALVGGYDYQISKFNRVTQAKRQPGSGFKPIIYSAALENGLNAASLINDAPIVFEDDNLERAWRPENYSEKIFGPTRLREGLVKSRNLVSIRVLRHIGIQQGRQHIIKFGFNPDDVPRDLSISLGSPNVPIIDMNRAFGVFANGGFLIKPYVIDAIYNQQNLPVYLHRDVLACDRCAKDAADIEVDPPADEPQQPPLIQVNAQDQDVVKHNDDNNVPVVTEPEAIKAPRVISAENAFIIDSFMQEVIQRGTGVRAKSLGRNDLAGKTGTTNDQMDAWFNGYHPHVVTNVWVGFDTPEPMGRGEVGGRVALPIWIDYMQTALQDLPEQTRTIPAGVVSARIDPDSGELLPPGASGGRLEYFMVGRLPPAKDEQEKIDYDDLF
ncbi:penicillin-binding protein 1A [Marinicella pacifica]|jgi:penicillin-binding protein 1A|uniref:Penicillin-binding protein 1A n=1 Tax=Marinicella pacifica TaxID=1171543 RepID=A0A917CWD0_9GAMM|nr:penicillin-binding protein 1A [Marinicella pacifica]GGG00631.1 penicillin-binding protein 1A [Marinicella pacifica]